MNGISLAIISFVGLESISHAAEETHRPASIIPRTSIALILTILIFALAYSNLALGMKPWHADSARRARRTSQPFYQYSRASPANNDKAVALIAQNIPYFGAIAGLYVPVLGAILLLISSNSGVFGASRIAYSMSQFQLLPERLRKIDKKIPHAGRLDRVVLRRRGGRADLRRVARRRRLQVLWATSTRSAPRRVIRSCSAR